MLRCTRLVVFHSKGNVKLSGKCSPRTPTTQLKGSLRSQQMLKAGNCETSRTWPRSKCGTFYNIDFGIQPQFVEHATKPRLGRQGSASLRPRARLNRLASFQGPQVFLIGNQHQALGFVVVVLVCRVS